jgi:hypothetical protein
MGGGSVASCGLPVEDGIQLDIENCCNMTLCDTVSFFSEFWSSIEKYFIATAVAFEKTVSWESLGCIKTRVVDPDSVTLWIRIRIGNPEPGERNLRNFSGKMHFLKCYRYRYY